MSSSECPQTIQQRYVRAAWRTGPKSAGAIPGADVGGYWVDNDCFFFLADAFDSSLNRVVKRPSVADLRTGRVEEVIPLEELGALISERSGRPVPLARLADAVIDMHDRTTLGVSVDRMDYLVDTDGRRVLSAAKELSVPALYSPDGRYACFVQDYDLWLKERDTGRERVLTMGGAAHYCCGRHSEINLSALTYRRRPYPLGLWSPDSTWFLTCRIDERHLPDFALIQSAPSDGRRFQLHRYKYPTPDDPLPIAAYVAIHIPTGRVVTFEQFPILATSLAPYLVSSSWFGRNDTAWFVHFDRYFKRCELVSLDLQNHTGRVVLTESVDSGYIDLQPVFGRTPNVRTLAGSNEVIWYSERDGWGHLYLYDSLTGALKNQITRGEWVVRDIVHVDEEQRKVLFLAGGLDPKVDPARRSLCSIRLDGTGFELLLSHDGDVYLSSTEPRGHGQDRPFRPSNSPAGVSPDGRCGVVQYTNIDQGNVTAIVDLVRRRNCVALASELRSGGEAAPRQFTALAADERTRLYGVMFTPPDFDASRRYALVDFIYPGPQYAHRPQAFRSLNSFPARALAELGFITVMIDSRGTPLRSRAFHQAGYGQLLEPQLSDHVAVLRQLCAQFPFIDSDRIGILGQSAGGAATVRALCDYGDVFKVGVAVCGVHDSSLHVSMWSDKYRGPPDSESWAEQANDTVAAKLRGRLLLISGDMDECVHVSHTLLLADALIRANRDFDMLIVPNAGHDILMTNAYAQRRVWDYFVRHLLGEEPPREFELRFEQHEVERFTWRSAREYR